MSSEAYYAKIVEEAVGSMELEGFSPTDDDRRLAYKCVSGEITLEEAIKAITG